MSWEWIEGSRAFDLLFGSVTSAACLSLAVPILWWYLPKHRRAIFSERIDPHHRFHLAAGLACMAMAFTDFLCRAIPHAEIPIAHPAFFVITLVLVAGFGPRVAYETLRGDRRRPATVSRT